MTDLTAISTPFGLLDRETQEALKTHGGPWEYYDGEWDETDVPMWIDRTVYRVKPAPPKPREWWLRLDANGEIRGSDPADGNWPPNWDAQYVIKVCEVLPE